MTKPWLVGSNPSQRYPIWTRANVGEVFPDPVAPYSYTLLMSTEAEGGWRDAMVRIGAFTHDEFADGEMECLGVHGGYCYLNASISRIYGERAPGLSAQAIDDLFFGAQPGIPPYVAGPTDQNEERTAAIQQTFNWVMTTDKIDYAAEGEKLVDGLRADRPDLAAMSNQELFDYGRKLMHTHFRKLFSEHIYTTFLSTIPVGTLIEICTKIGRPEDALRIISGVGDVQSAAPSMAMWKLGRQVAGDAALNAAFDAGVDGLLDRLADAGPSGKAFLDGFAQFIREYGARGPNEWEGRSKTWELKPELALVAIDRMRLAGPEADPALKNRQLAAQRERLVGEIAPMLEGDPQAHGTFMAAAHAAVVFQAGRERTKTNCIRMAHEARMAAHVAGQRLVEQGVIDDSGDYVFLRADEIDPWLADPAKFTETIRERRAQFDEYSALQEPFVFEGTVPAVDTWPPKKDAQVTVAKEGEVLEGFPGCPGKATGTARVVLDPLDPTALEPGDILVAPHTDPAWTPLFVAAGGVVVDVGAAQSHAVIVSRELGIPCVPSATGATRRIPNGATVRVDGDTGTVTVLSVP